MMDAVPLLSSLGRHSARLNSLTEEMIRLEELGGLTLPSVIVCVIDER
jgi:hypothetical protein